MNREIDGGLGRWMERQRKDGWREREREDGGTDETVGWGEVNGGLGMDGWMDGFGAPSRP